MKLGHSRYFPGLNSLRFVAALSVMIGHIELYKYWAGLPSAYSQNVCIRSLPVQGVLFFFVLSGFLITYLLLDEIKTRGSINVPLFYMRRALRILPLYLLITLLSVWIVPMLPWSDSVVNAIVTRDFPVLRLPLVRALFLGMGPNIVLQIFPPLLFAGPLWSIGVEEQFYLIWPWLLRFFSKGGVWFIAGTILLKIVLVRGLGWIGSPTAIIVRDFIGAGRWEALAIGGIGGYLARMNPHALKKLVSPLGEALALPMLILALAFGLVLSDGGSMLLSLIYLTALVNMYHAKGTGWAWLQRGPLDYLGRISYGFYVYHSFVIIGILKWLEPAHQVGTIGGTVILYLGTLLLTIVLASLSYQYFEMPFLEWKSRFAPRAPVSRRGAVRRRATAS